MSKTGSSKKSGTQNKLISRKGSELRGEEVDDYEMVSKVDSQFLQRRPSAFENNPHFRRSVINSMLRGSEAQNENERHPSVVSSNQHNQIV